MGVALVMNKPSHIEFTLVNTGEAVVTGCNWKTTVLLLDSIGAVHGVPTFGSEGADSYNKPLHVGEGIVRNLLNPIELDPADHIVISNKQEFLHVLGYIAYSDAVGVTRRTGFFRYYDPDRRRFRKVDDPEYEYQD